MEIIEVDINKIKTNPNQPRKEFDKEKLQELADSIKERGLINPIQIKQSGEGYELICGERRLKAHKLADKKTIKAIVKEYASKSDEMIESLIENLHRADLNSVEKENYITALWKTGNYKNYTELGKALGLSETHVKTNLSAKIIREKTQPGRVSTRDIRETSPVKDIEDKKSLLKKVEKGEINSDKIREVARVISKSPADVKQAYFNDKISINQAEIISKIENENTRRKMIKAHNEIKNIDNSIEKSVKTELKKELSKAKEIRIKESINEFRQNSVESQKMIHIAIKSLIRLMPLINIMDDAQIKKLKHFQELFNTNLSNVLELSESLQDKIQEYNNNP